MATIDIDVGGTFTDCFISGGDRAAIAKAPTTYYDLKVSFIKCLKEGAEKLGCSLEELLENTSSVRYSTTIGTNSLIERNGPKLGLITTKGFEDVVFIGRARQWADGAGMSEINDLARIDKPEPLIPRDMVVGIQERINYLGKVLMPINPEEVREKVQYLVDRGATGFVVCFLWSFKNNEHERIVRDIIEEEYPESYLGNAPVLLSSEVSPKMGEYGRFMTTIVNAYMHRDLSEQLRGLEEELKDQGFLRPLTLVHNTGGTKKLTRTKAVYTHNAGPVSGVYGSLYVGRLYGIDNIIYTDMGGTSFDLGVVSGGEIKSYDFIPVIDRWRTQINAVETKSIGAGGGSIGWLNQALGNLLDVGPASAGAMPGPAAYNLGGAEPTVTDADMVLGYLNPSYYLGGRMRLSAEKARRAIEERIARPLGIDVIEAAYKIKKIIDAKMGQEIYKEVSLKGHDSREYALFASGGAGPTHCCGYNTYVESPKIITCPFSPVFGAFGATTLDVMHIYDKSNYIKLLFSGGRDYFDCYDEFNSQVQHLMLQAENDMFMEGFSRQQIHYTLELEMKYGTTFTTTKITSPCLFINSADDVKAICDAFSREYGRLYSQEAAYPEGGIDLETFYLKAAVSVPHFDFRPGTLKPASPSPAALKVTRDVFWGLYGDFRPTPIYAFELLECGNIVEGPAVVEAEDTTYVIEPGYLFNIDGYGNGIFERIR